MNTSPWSSLGMLQVGAGNALAAVMLTAGWVLVERGTELGSQVAWLNLSIAGLLVALWVNVRWLLDGRRAVGLLIRRLDPGLSAGPSETRSSAPDVRPATPGALVAGRGLLRYHRTSCLLAQGKDWDAASAETHRAEGRTPCGVCRP